ncbi:hypothetical protein DFQ26_009884 [Actinomortierella ambigua]|nr:hypothetical protein DFQ26_009884 [Actinomortierella ambigua]
MALREENFVVLHSGSWVTRAGINVTDTNKPPSVVIRSLVGARTISQEATQQKDEDESTHPSPRDDATKSQDNIDVDAKETASEATKDDSVAPEDTPSTQTVYYCGNALTEAQQQFNQDELTLTSPIREGIVRDWGAMEALWRHVLFRELGIKRSRNASPVLMVVPTDWTKEEHERITQIFFESFNVPGLYLAEEPLMTLYGCGSVTGLIVDIGHNSTEITPIIDTQIQRHAIQSIPLAGADIDAHFLQLLKADTQLVKEYGQPLDLEFARHLKESGVCQALSGDEKESKARVTAEYNGKEFTVGAARYKAVDPLFNVDLTGKAVMNVIEAIHAAQLACKAEKRITLWESIVITGGSCQIKGLQGRIQQELEKSLAVSENFGEYQIRDVRFLKVPDYFPNLKDSIVHAGFLGAEIVAKLIFPDPRNYINKVDYNEAGPSVVHTKTF